MQTRVSTRRKADTGHLPAAQLQLCLRLPRATLATLQTAADPALTTDFKTILD